MEFPMYQQQAFPWHYLLAYPSPFSYSLRPENYVHWVQTPESHIYSADLPGTQSTDEATRPPAKSFMRKFRLPGSVDIDGISAGYEDGVLTVTVPRSYKRGLLIDQSALPERLEVTARAA
ncbi:heat-shock protein, putative [Ricinus communis]|uniref:Heat-shock protein, putative n=1 Tax=Ricinus communis TaxID=3988 RepID=B9RXN2_RICCO|nr:heat-shock protein, putative [Ricinus communis]